MNVSSIHGLRPFCRRIDTAANATLERNTLYFESWVLCLTVNILENGALLESSWEADRARRAGAVPR
jgi:hypothetical protein